MMLHDQFNWMTTTWVLLQISYQWQAVQLQGTLKSDLKVSHQYLILANLLTCIIDIFILENLLNVLVDLIFAVGRLCDILDPFICKFSDFKDNSGRFYLK